MSKYHITAKGEPGVCRAKHSCPLGGENEHYPTKEEAQKAFEKQSSEQTFNTVKKTTKTENKPLKYAIPGSIKAKSSIVNGRTLNAIKRNAIEEYSKVRDAKQVTPENAYDELGKPRLYYLDYTSEIEYDENDNKLYLSVYLEPSSEGIEPYYDIKPAAKTYYTREYYNNSQRIEYEEIEVYKYELSDNLKKSYTDYQEKKKLEYFVEAAEDPNLPDWALLKTEYYGRAFVYPPRTNLRLENKIMQIEKKIDSYDKLEKRYSKKKEELDQKEEELKQVKDAKKLVEDSPPALKAINVGVKKLEEDVERINKTLAQYSSSISKSKDELKKELDDTKKELEESFKEIDIKRKEALIKNLSFHYPHKNSRVRVAAAKEWVEAHPDSVKKDFISYW